jgi:hypothetical protein
MKNDDFGKPIIAVANSFTQFVPGHVHLKDLGDDYHVYRRVGGERQPITPDGNQYGSISQQNGTTVSTYSGADGEVTVEYVTDPTFVEDVQWRIQTLQERVPNLPFTVGPPVGV